MASRRRLYSSTSTWEPKHLAARACPMAGAFTNPRIRLASTSPCNNSSLSGISGATAI